MKRLLKILFVLLVFLLIGSTALSSSVRVDNNYLTNFYGFMSNMYYKDISYDDLLGGSLNGLLQDTNSYSCYEQSSNGIGTGNKTVGVSLEKVRQGLLVSAIYHGTVATRVGLEVGDVIYRVDRLSTSITSTQDLDSLIAASAGRATIDVIKKSTGKSVTYDVSLDDGYVSYVDYFISKDIGYIRINQFVDDTSTIVLEALSWFEQNNVDFILLDMRDLISMNIKEASEVADFFLPYGRITSGGDITYSASFKRDYKTVNIIINENTGGAGEVIAKAIKNHGTGAIYGETSMGQVYVRNSYPVFVDSAFLYLSEKADSTDIKTIINYTKLHDIIITDDFMSGMIHIVEDELVDNFNQSYKDGVLPDYVVDVAKEYITTSPDEEGMWIRKDYKLGDLSYDIYIAEKILLKLGLFSSVPDVTYNQETLEAVNEFKVLINVEADGVLDMATQNILNYELFKEQVINETCLQIIIAMIKGE